MILRWTVIAVSDAATRFHRITGARDVRVHGWDTGRHLNANKTAVSDVIAFSGAAGGGEAYP